MAQVRAFHEKFGQPDEAEPVIPHEHRVSLRRRLHNEEYNELAVEMHKAHHLSAAGVVDPECLEAIAKELCDLIYVCVGTALEFGLPLDRAWAEVCASNMTKEPDPHGLKVRKGPDYRPPDIHRAIWGAGGEGDNG